MLLFYCRDIYHVVKSLVTSGTECEMRILKALPKLFIFIYEEISPTNFIKYISFCLEINHCWHCHAVLSRTKWCSYMFF